jgi:hypothetical protein
VSLEPCCASLPRTSLLLRYLKRQPGQLGIYDPLEINNRRNIKLSMRVRSLSDDLVENRGTYSTGLPDSIAVLPRVLLSVLVSVSTAKERIEPRLSSFVHSRLIQALL